MRPHKRKLIEKMLEEGWDARRAKLAARRAHANKTCQEWKEREKLGLNKERRLHYLNISSNIDTSNNKTA